MGAAVGPAVAAFFSSTTWYVVVVRTILINVVLGALTRALTQRDAKQFAPPVNVTIRNSVENRRIIFGAPRASGVIAFYRQSNKNPSDGAYLHYVVVLAGHQVNAITDVWLDKVRITNAQIDAGTGEVTDGPFAGKVYIWKHLGRSDQTVDTVLDDAMISSFWTTDHRFRGCAYLHVRMERDDTAFPSGAPQDVTAITEGLLVYDPRLDSTNGGSGSHRMDNPSTWAFSRNPALHARWWLTGGSVINDLTTRQVMYGLQEPNTRIVDSYVVAAANICDEQLTGTHTTPDGDQIRYTCDVEVSTGEPRRDILEAILATMVGRAVNVHGQWRIYAGAYDAPTHALTQDDLYGPIEIEDTTSHEERYNAVAAVFRDAGNGYIDQTSAFQTDSAYETQDGSQFIPKEIDLRGVTDKYRVQRICQIELRRSRLMRTIKLVGALNLLKIAQHETLTLSHTRLAWTSRVFRCAEREFQFQEEAGRVVITAKAESSTVYDDMLTADYITPNTIIPVRTAEAPDPPTGLVTVPQTDAILVKWTRSPTPGVTYELEQSTSSTMSSPTVVYDGTDNQAYIDQVGTTTFYYRVRAKKSGQYSPYLPTSGGTGGAALGITVTLSGSVSPGAASSSGTGASQTTGSVTVTPTGGSTPYTYAWTWASGGSGITITSAAAASTTFSATGLGDPETRTGTARCTITDNAAATKTLDVAVSIERTPSFSATAAGTAPTTKSANNSTITSNNITATPVGGTGPFTYVWSIVSHDDPNSTPTINNSTSATCTVTTNQAPSSQTTVNVVVRCAVTDTATANVVNTNTVTVSHTHDNGA